MVRIFETKDDNISQSYKYTDYRHTFGGSGSGIFSDVTLEKNIPIENISKRDIFKIMKYAESIENDDFKCNVIFDKSGEPKLILSPDIGVSAFFDSMVGLQIF